MKLIKNVIKVTFSVVFLLSISAAVINRQAVYDWYALLDYSPSTEISNLAINAGMSTKATKVFFVYKPEILEKTSFNISCPINEETIVLGCYNGKNIYLFNVTDTSLKGIKEVTAAHEMLHAQYDRLSVKEKARVDALIDKELNKLSDSRIKANIEAYRKKDPSIVTNEAHSILGTEVSALDPELEKYYSQYFDDRNKVVKLSADYEAVFTSLKKQIENFDNQLGNLKSEIDTKENALTNQANDLISWSSRLETLKKDNKISEYNSQVYSYNAGVEEYRKNVAYVKSLIGKYNSIVEDRNNLSLQQSNLYQSIDSKSKEL